MSVLVDNTGLQSAAYCLEARARSRNDVLGLLQLAGLLIFADKVVVNTCSSKPVLQQSDQAIGLVREQGVDQEIVGLCDVKADVFASICESAAEQSIEPLDGVSWKDEPPSSPLAPEIVKGVADQGFLSLLSRLRDSDSDEILKETRDRAFSDEYFGSADYMVVCNDRLRNAILKAAAEADWNEFAIERIRTFLRSQIYFEVGLEADAAYVPSLSRARLIRERFRPLIALLEGLDEVVNDFRGVPLKVPSVYAALLKQSQGDPRGLFETALELRSRAGPIHKELSRIRREYNLTDPGEKAKADRRIKEVSRDLRKTLEISQAPPLERTLEVLGQVPPFSKLEYGRLIDWMLRGIRSHRVQVLTDIAWVAMDPEDSEEELRKLEKNSGLD